MQVDVVFMGMSPDGISEDVVEEFLAAEADVVNGGSRQVALVQEAADAAEGIHYVIVGETYGDVEGSAFRSLWDKRQGCHRWPSVMNHCRVGKQQDGQDEGGGGIAPPEKGGTDVGKQPYDEHHQGELCDADDDADRPIAEYLVEGVEKGDEGVGQKD